MPVFKIHHSTRYEYDRLVKESMNEIRIFPYQCPEQEILQQQLLITGFPDVQHFTDYWGNHAGTFNLLQAHKELVIESRVMVRTMQPETFTPDKGAGFKDLQAEVDQQLHMLELSKPDPVESQDVLDKMVGSLYDPEGSVAVVVEQASDFIFGQFQYIKGITNVETTVDELLKEHAGVCQDFAHVLLQLLRTMNIPCRYVSGYICPNKNGMRGEGATHAWIEAWIPGMGWTGIDPTNNVWVTNTHVKLAVGRDFKDCTPVKGSFKGPSQQLLSVYVSVGYEDGHVFEERNKVRIQSQFEVPPQVLEVQEVQQQ